MRMTWRLNRVVLYSIFRLTNPCAGVSYILVKSNEYSQPIDWPESLKTGDEKSFMGALPRTTFRSISLTVLFALLFSAAAVKADETYLRLTVRSKAEIGKLTRIISIDNVVADTVFAYAQPRQLANLSAAGYSYTVLPSLSSLAHPKMAPSTAAYAWDSYPTYDQYVAMMQQYAINYPALCHLDTIGTTANGRLLLMASISGNVGTEQDEPEVLYTSTMHGDEVTGYVLMLRFIDSLLTGYGVDAHVTDMVNNMKIYINPLANPDGTYHGGNSTVAFATRSNGNNVDLNRNFPDPMDGPHPDNLNWQPETVAFMNFATAHSIILSTNFHGGFEVVNYPWDCWTPRHADDAWFQMICRAYADTCHVYSPDYYMTNMNNGVTNGFDWYDVHGGRQDYMNYNQGCREVTIELSGVKILAVDSLTLYWEYNRRSFFQYIEQARYGIHGIVTSSANGQPLTATIHVANHDVDHSEVRTDPVAGDYHRMIKGGTYTLQFSSSGFATKTVPNVSVSDYGSTRLDVQLDPLPNTPALAFVSHTAKSFNGGDTVAFAITLANTGAADAVNAKGTLSSSDALVQILADTATFPAITALTGVSSSSPVFRFAVGSTASAGRTLPFVLHVIADGGYSDSLSFTATAGQRIEDFETGNFAKYPWQFSGYRAWTVDGSTANSGAYSARSGVIPGSQSTQLFVTQSDLRAGDISFYVRTSTEGGYDILSFDIDGVPQGNWSGDISWTKVSLPVTAGSHTFRWTYSKDGGYTVGSDAVWIDDITFPYQTCCVGTTGNVDGDTMNVIDISDLSAMIDFLFFELPLSSCAESNDVDRSGNVDIADAQMLIDYLFFSGPLPSCP
jgi:hypothetical protein